LDNPRLHGVYLGVWDTGATTSLVTHKVFSDLNLTPVDTVTVHGVNSSVRAQVVVIDLILPNGIKISGVRATVSETRGIDMLIGMDIIQLGDFSISNFEGKTIFTFAMPPFRDRTDLYEKSMLVAKGN
jgi:predicted aspartyl protease